MSMAATQFHKLKRFSFSFPFPVSKPTSSLFFSSSSSSSNTTTTTSTSQNLVETAVSILTHHRSKSRWTTLHSVCTPNNGFNPTQFSQIALCLKNKPHLVLNFFLFTKSKSLCNHNLHSYCTIAHVLARARLKTHAQSAIRLAIRASELQNDDDEEVEEEKCRFDSPPLKVFEHLVRTYRECDSAPFVFDLLIRACLDSRKVDPSIEIVRMLTSRGISPKVCTLNNLISKVCRIRGFGAAYEIYKEFFNVGEEKEGILKRGLGFRVAPNVHTYNELMLCCYQDGLVGKVEEIWNEMGAVKCVPNAYSYSVLMAAFCDEGRMIDAEKLWEEMRNEKIEPDVVCYNTIIGGFCKIGDVQRAEEFFREMQLGGILSTNATYEHLVKGYCNIGDTDSAVLVYQDFCRKGFRPDASILDMMIRLHCDKGSVDEALEFVRHAASRFDLVPKGKSYEALIERLCCEERMEEALKVQAEMVGKGFQPSSEIYGTFIDGYIRQGKEDMARALRKEMLQMQMQMQN